MRIYANQKRSKLSGGFVRESISANSNPLKLEAVE